MPNSTQNPMGASDLASERTLGLIFSYTIFDCTEVVIKNV